MTPSTKIDHRIGLRQLYAPGGEPAIVDVPELAFLMIDGHGDPNASAEYSEAVEALYTVAYAAKFAVRRTDGIDYRVMPLEGLWWASDMSAFTRGDKSDWDWTMMIMQPGPATPEIVEEARAKAAKKKPLDAIARLRFERFAEGPAAQIMHIGPYAAEGPAIQRLHAFIADQGYERAGKHHEIYLNDPRRCAPEKLKTVLRQPVTAADGTGRHA